MLPAEIKQNLSSNTNRKNPKSQNKNKTKNNKSVSAQKKKQKKKNFFKKFEQKHERKPPEICKYFISGSCKNDDCTYSHDVTPDQMRRFNEPCKYYATGECAKGDMCCFMHGNFPCTFFHSKSGNKCRKGDLCLFSHDPLTEETSLALEKYLEFQSKRGQSVVEPESVLQQPIQPDFGKSTIFTKNTEESLESSNGILGIKYSDEECSKDDENKNRISNLKDTSQSSFLNSLVIENRHGEEMEDSESLSTNEKDKLNEASVKMLDNYSDTDKDWDDSLQIEENKNNFTNLNRVPQSSFSNSLFINYGQDSETEDVLPQSNHQLTQNHKETLNENSTEILKNKNPNILETLASNLKNIPTFTKIYDSDSENELRICDLNDEIISKVHDHKKGGGNDKPSIIGSSNSMDISSQEAPFDRNVQLNDQNIDPLFPSNNIKAGLEISDHNQTFIPRYLPENRQVNFENIRTNDKEINWQKEKIDNKDNVMYHENVESNFEKNNLNNKGRKTKQIKSQQFDKTSGRNSSLVEQCLKRTIGSRKRKSVTMDRNNTSPQKLQKSLKLISCTRQNKSVSELVEKETVASDKKDAIEDGKWEFFKDPFSFDESNFMEECSMFEITESLNLIIKTDLPNYTLNNENSVSNPVNISCDLNNMTVERDDSESINSNVNTQLTDSSQMNVERGDIESINSNADTQLTDSSQIFVPQNPVNIDGNEMSLISCCQVSSMSAQQSDLNKMTQSVWPPPMLILPPAQSYHEMNIKCYHLHHKFDDPRIENHPQALKPHWSDWILSL